MANEGYEYSRDRDYGRSKRGGSPPVDQHEYERPRRRTDYHCDSNYRYDDRDYRSNAFGNNRGSYAEASTFLPRGQYIAVSRIVDKKVEQALREREYEQREQRGGHCYPQPPPPARRGDDPAPKPAADPAVVDQLAKAKLENLKLQEELEQLRAAVAKRKEQQKKKRAKQQQKRAAAAASSSEEDSQPKQDETAEASEQLASLSFKEVVMGAPKAAAPTAAGRRKSSPAALPGNGDCNLPVKLVAKLLALNSLTESSVKHAIGKLYEGPVNKLMPLWQVVLPGQELPSTKTAALTGIYKAIQADISSLKG
jgi:hypothetical protein